MFVLPMLQLLLHWLPFAFIGTAVLASALALVGLVLDRRQPPGRDADYRLPR